jgi:hypothetical protein
MSPIKPVLSINQETFFYLKKLAESRFWGSVTLKFEAGRITHIRREENLKPIELSEVPRSEYGNESTTHSR